MQRLPSALAFLPGRLGGTRESCNNLHLASIRDRGGEARPPHLLCCPFNWRCSGRGSCLFSLEANLSMLCLCKVESRCLNTLGASCQFYVSVFLLSLSAHIFSALVMYCVMMRMSSSSVRRKSFLSSDIIAVDLDVRWVKTPTTDWLSSCSRSLRPFNSGRNDSTAHLTDFGSLKVMCVCLSYPVMNPLASM